MTPKPDSATTLSTNGIAAHEVLIRGRCYDVTEWHKRHPGGGIINFYLGQDATDAFNAFHPRSAAKVERYLKVVPSRDLMPPSGESVGHQSSLVEDFEQLRLDLYREGYFEPSLGHVVYRLAELLIMHLIGMQLLWSGWVTAGVVLLGVAQGRCGWVMHEGGHYSLTGNVTVDRRIQEVVYGLGCGMSAAYWRNQHNKHHAMPQKLKHDVDLNTLPLVAFHARIAKNGNPRWLRWQAYVFTPLVTLIVALTWQFYLHPRYSFRMGRPQEVAYYVARLLSIFLFVLSDYGAGQRLALYLAYVWVGAACIFTNFALSHTHRAVLGADEQSDWVRFAGVHTVDVEQRPWCDWWMGYLNYQIEHHLFPTMPQFRNSLVAPRVRSLFQKHGVPYDVLSYWDALCVTFANLDKVGKTAANGVAGEN